MRMQQRRKPAATWTSSNEQLLDGELGIESDTGKWKVGDGSTAWNALAYQPSNAGISAAISTAVANLVNGAPGTVDTLKELADALGDDPNFATTVTNALAAKANTSSLAPVATAGSYASLTGKPSLATVAGTGAYTDLTAKPTLGTAAAAATTDFDAAGAAAAAQAYAIQRGNHTGTQPASTITGLAAVATSGVYTDLTGRPTIPTVPASNFTATTDPTVTADSGSGYSTGSRWINTATNAAYECLTATAGAAVWRRLTADVQAFTTSGTWTRPAWCQFVEVAVIGGGGGGGSGARRSSTATSSGGGGGGGGGFATAMFPAGTVSATETITVGTGGTGGAAVTVNDTNGANGVAGTASSFGIRLKANGGAAGTLGQTGSGSGGGGGGSAMIAGGNGSAGSNAAAGSNASSGSAAGGGAAGGGLTATPTFTSGGNGGAPNAVNVFGGGGATSDATSGGAGGSATTGAALPGGGGGGGASSVAANGGTGGTGGLYGGGGGGGGGSVNGSSSGAGGAGAAGIVIIISR